MQGSAALIVVVDVLVLVCVGGAVVSGQSIDDGGLVFDQLRWQATIVADKLLPGAVKGGEIVPVLSSYSTKTCVII
ncbi:hypothetical protein F4778DRAFT_758150 [Xylariomycetidae sp. FL2044]|nr:hypothetical protein F4778DRAFT_758150 [Xylariomycetidae sp. FL2044]